MVKCPQCGEEFELVEPTPHQEYPKWVDGKIVHSQEEEDDSDLGDGPVPEAPPPKAKLKLKL